MPLNVYIVLDRQDTFGFGTSTTTVEFPRRGAYIILMLATIATQRVYWEKMSDAQWDNLSSDIALGIEALQLAVQG